MLQQQSERIAQIIEGEISGVRVAEGYPAQIDSFLPVCIPMVASVPYEQMDQHRTYSVTTQWDLWLYLATLTSGLTVVNQVNIYEYLDEFADAFLERPLLQYSGSALAFVRNSEFSLVSGLSAPVRYPPRNGQALYWGCQYRLTITSTNFQKRSISGA